MDEYQNNCEASLLSSKTCGNGTNPTAQPQESPQAQEETGGFFPFYLPQLYKRETEAGREQGRGSWPFSPGAESFAGQLMSFKG